MVKLSPVNQFCISRRGVTKYFAKYIFFSFFPSFLFTLVMSEFYSALPLFICLISVTFPLSVSCLWKFLLFFHIIVLRCFCIFRPFLRISVLVCLCVSERLSVCVCVSFSGIRLLGKTCNYSDSEAAGLSLRNIFFVLSCVHFTGALRFSP